MSYCINLTKSFCCLSKRHDQCTCKTLVHNKIINLQFRKHAVFRVLTENTENQVKLRYTNIDNLPSEQFYTHLSVCCVVTRLILKPTDLTKKEYRQ